VVYLKWTIQGSRDISKRRGREAQLSGRESRCREVEIWDSLWSLPKEAPLWRFGRTETQQKELINTFTTPVHLSARRGSTVDWDGLTAAHKAWTLHYSPAAFDRNECMKAFGSLMSDYRTRAACHDPPTTSKYSSNFARMLRLTTPLPGTLECRRLNALDSAIRSLYRQATV